MKIVIIGAGNLATNLAKALVKVGHHIVQVYSRTMKSAETLAHIVDAEAVTDIASVCTDADLYVLSVKDSALEGLLASLCRGKEDKVFLHTAGSMPMDVFAGKAKHFGVLYPMQTFSKSKEVDFSVIPCFVEYNDPQSQAMIGDLANQLSTKVFKLSSEARKYLHLSAVFACNFANHCYAISQQLLSSHGIPFEVMLPLIDETARKVHQLSPLEAQTGPAVRYDENIIRNQSALLEDSPLMKEIYELMSKEIHLFAETGKTPLSEKHEG